MKKRKIYTMAILAAFNFANRAAREHLGHYDDPIPMEVRYEGVLIGQETLEKRRVKHLESIIRMDSALGRKSGRYYQLRELRVNRARKELEQIRARQKERTNK